MNLDRALTIQSIQWRKLALGASGASFTVSEEEIAAEAKQYSQKEREANSFVRYEDEPSTPV